MSDIFAEFEADAKSAPSTEALSNVAILAERQLNLMLRIDDVNKQLADLQGQLRKVQEQELPDALLSANCQEFKLANGKKITIKKFYSASIKEEKQEECFAWLESHDLGDVIKSKIALSFGKGEDEQAKKVQKVLGEMGYEVECKKSVHPMTLKSLVKEQLEGDNEFPQELFGVYVGNQAIIK